MFSEKKKVFCFADPRHGGRRIGNAGEIRRSAQAFVGRAEGFAGGLDPESRT
jgi:hypothetical protein